MGFSAWNNQSTRIAPDRSLAEYSDAAYWIITNRQTEDACCYES
jgi:hypothetical protein